MVEIYVNMDVKRVKYGKRLWLSLTLGSNRVLPKLDVRL